jgi:NAD(P)-dependent dehydrogenase (short-subunit alcohol dehydrogenase family)
MQDFKAKTAVITGGASGMGRGTARALARRGANVVIADLNEARMAETVAELNGLGVAAFAVRCDVSKAEDIEHLAEAARARFGTINVLMNNAGTLPVGHFESTPLEAWRRVLDVNLLSVVAGVRTFLPDLLAAAGDAHVVNTASLAGLLAYDTTAIPYAVSKAAVVSLSEGLALSLRPRGIGVTCLCPGPVRTNIGEQVTRFGDSTGLGEYASSRFTWRTPDEVGELVAGAIESGRFLLPTNEEAFDYIARHGADCDGFLREVEAFLTKADC